jgi:hypothetical protein
MSLTCFAMGFLVPGRYYVQLGPRSVAAFEGVVPKACKFGVVTSELSSSHMTGTFGRTLVPEVNCEFK